MRATRSVWVAVAVTAAATAVPPGAALSAQDVEGSLGQLTRENGRLYLRPVFEGLGVALNSGFAESAPAHQPLGFDVGVRVMGAIVPDGRKSFRPVLPARVEVDGRTFDDPYVVANGATGTPTAVGVGDGVTVIPSDEVAEALRNAGEDPESEEWTFRFPGGYDVPTVPFVILQGSLGIGFHTDATVRFTPAVEPDPDLGEVRAFGIGAKHEISGWLGPATPIDVALAGGYQNLEVGEYLEATTTTLALIVGRSVGPLDVYAVGRTLNPSMDVRYRAVNPGGNPLSPSDGAPVDFRADLASDTHFGIGANLRLFLLNISGQMTFGDYDVASLKAGLSFR